MGATVNGVLGLTVAIVNSQVSNRMGNEQRYPIIWRLSMQDDDLSSVDGHGTKKNAQTDGTGGGYAVRTCLLPT